MALKDIKNNRIVIDRIINMVSKNLISHAYIFEGDYSLDKMKIAVEFVKSILCNEDKDGSCDSCITCKKIQHNNHEDIFIIEKDGNSIKDETVETIQEKIKKKPLGGERNIVIIRDADSMTLRAQNRLLKTLEEPLSGVIIILLSENVENLVQTILSRCVIFKLNSFKNEESLDLDLKAVKLANMILMNASFYEINTIMTEYITNKDDAHKLLDFMEIWYRDLALYNFDQNIIINKSNINEIEKYSRLVSRTKLERAVKCIETAKNDLNRNINISYTMKNMILDIIA